MSDDHEEEEYFTADSANDDDDDEVDDEAINDDDDEDDDDEEEEGEDIEIDLSSHQWRQALGDDEEVDESSAMRIIQHYFSLLQQQIAGGGTGRQGRAQNRDDDDETGGLVPVNQSTYQPDRILQHDLAQELRYRTGCHPAKEDRSVIRMLRAREHGLRGFGRTQRVHAAQRYLPGVHVPLSPPLLAPVKKIAKPRRAGQRGGSYDSSSAYIIDEYEEQVFCCKYSKDGQRFMTACQDRRIRLYDADTWTIQNTIDAQDVGWSIIDTDFSPDQRFMIYSSWSDYIHLVDIGGDSNTHQALDIKPQSHRFCLFSIQFSHTSNEILAGSSDRHLYIYDLERQERTLRLKAHTDDINSVTWADETGQLLFSGSDDTICKVWDRRQLNSQHEKPVGLLFGHVEGITHVSSKGDGRYLITNSKDQSIKLWDIRMMRDGRESAETVHNSYWDYRRTAFDHLGVSSTQKKVFQGELVHPQDGSLKTYRGHKVFQTLIRAYFSPEASTGQRYIYSGSYDGSVHIFDVLTGELVSKLEGHSATVRDVAWHPTLPTIVSTSWDGRVLRWEGHDRHLTASEDDADQSGLPPLIDEADIDASLGRRVRRLYE